MTSERRSNLLIKREFQLGFIARLVGLVVLGGVLAGILVYVAVGMELQALAFQVHRRAPEAQSAILSWIVLANGLAILLVSGAAAWVTLYTLHRVAGPLTRMESIVREIGDGDLTVSTRLRENDELQEFPAALSEMVASLATTVRGLRQAHQGLRREIEALPADPSTAEHSASLRERLQEAENLVAKFKCPSEKDAG